MRAPQPMFASDADVDAVAAAAAFTRGADGFFAEATASAMSAAGCSMPRLTP